MSIIGVDKSQVLSADDAPAGERCQGAGNLADFGGGEEVVVLDADGSKVAVGKLDEGTLPETAEQLGQLGLNSCTLSFTVDAIPAGDGLFTLEIGQSHTTFNAKEAAGLEVTVAGDEYP